MYKTFGRKKKADSLIQQTIAQRMMQSTEHTLWFDLLHWYNIQPFSFSKHSHLIFWFKAQSASWLTKIYFKALHPSSVKWQSVEDIDPYEQLQCVVTSSLVTHPNQMCFDLIWYIFWCSQIFCWVCSRTRETKLNFLKSITVIGMIPVIQIHHWIFWRVWSPVQRKTPRSPI